MYPLQFGLSKQISAFPFPARGWASPSKFVKLLQALVWSVNFPDFNFWRFFPIWHKLTTVRPSCPEFSEIPLRLMRGAQCSPEMTAAHCERGKYEINVKNNMFWILRRKEFLICLLRVYGFSMFFLLGVYVFSFKGSFRYLWKAYLVGFAKMHS